MQNELLDFLQLLTTANLASASGIATVASFLTQIIKKYLYIRWESEKWYNILTQVTAIIISVGTAIIVGLICKTDLLLSLETGLLGAAGALFGYDILHQIMKLLKKE